MPTRTFWANARQKLGKLQTIDKNRLKLFFFSGGFCRGFAASQAFVDGFDLPLKTPESSTKTMYKVFVMVSIE
jgi:hypothetical protein